MTCPYCKEEMKEGGIPQDRMPLKWIAGEGAAGVMYPFKKGVMLTDYFERSYAIAHYCKQCRKIIVDMNENMEA